MKPIREFNQYGHKVILSLEHDTNHHLYLSPDDIELLGRIQSNVTKCATLHVSVFLDDLLIGTDSLRGYFYNDTNDFDNELIDQMIWSILYANS